jgi:hypothetical protein
VFEAALTSTAGISRCNSNFCSDTVNRLSIDRSASS